MTDTRNRAPLRPIALALATTALLAAQRALAQEGNDRDDRFTLRLSAFNPGADLRVGVEGEATDGVDTLTFADAATLDTGDDWRPRGALGFRISDRQSIGASYYDYENSDSWGFGGGVIDPGDPGDAVQLPTADADGQIKFAMASVHYEYAVIATPALEWGLGLGATHINLETIANVVWGATGEIEAGTSRFREKVNGWSPALHSRLTWRPADRWRVDFEGQYLNANWGDLIDEGGHFERAGIVLEYLVNERVGVHVGYDWFRVKLKDRFTGDFTLPPEAGIGPVDYNATANAELKVHGPLAGITYRF